MTEAMHAMTGGITLCAARLLLTFALAGSAAPAVLAQDAPAPAPAAAETPAPATPAAPSAEPATEPSAESSAESSAPGAVPAAGEAAPSAPAAKLLIASWGGVYSKSQEEAVFHPFTRATGIEITRKVYAGGLDDLRGQVTSRRGIWDVIDVEPADAEEGCEEGLLMKLDLDLLDLPTAPDGTPAEEDFLPGALQPCAVGSLAWSMAIAFSDSTGEIRADDIKPSSLQDFFDLERFPGQRGLRRTPMANLEWALLADGVPGDEVYDLLRSEAGVARAFAKLETIRDDIVWWEDAAEPARLLEEGHVVMTSTFNAPMFNAIVVREQPFAMIWDRQVWDLDLWAVPAITENRDAALAFVRFATTTEALARQTRWISYGPVRRSSLALVGDYVHADVEMARYLPTAEANFETALRNDALFWREQGPALVERFNAWLSR